MRGASRGGFGAVYRAFQSTVGREVAQSAPHCHVFRDRSSTQLWLNQRGKLTKSNGRFLANVSP
jgi:hypothetical protein